MKLQLFIFFLFYSFVTSCSKEKFEDIPFVLPVNKVRVFGKDTKFVSSSAYRIPCITSSSNNKILFATADIRYNSAADFGIIEVGFCRSFDGGKTWTDYSKIFKRKVDRNSYNRVHDCSMCIDGNPKSKYYGRIWAFAKMINVDLPESEWSTPGTVSFLSCYSDDNGSTWSEQIEMHGLFPKEAYHVSSGVAPGITLKNGTLVQPVYFTRSENGIRKQKASFIYSLNGEPWKLGPITPIAAGENSIIEQPDGTLVMNARNAFENTDKRRVFTLSSISGEWINKTEYEVFRTVNCQESLVYNNGVYLYSQPTGYENGTGRNRITIFKSKDLISWEKFILLTNASSYGYSTIILRDNLFGILYENQGPEYNITYSNLNELLPSVY